MFAKSMFNSFFKCWYIWLSTRIHNIKNLDTIILFISQNSTTNIFIGVKPFKCLFCDMSFRTSGHRKSHVMVAHISNRRRHTESRKVKIRKILESVASTILNDLESSQTILSESKNGPSPVGVPDALQVISF